jgi:hypothetical protein
MSNDKSDKKQVPLTGVPQRRTGVADLSYNIEHLRRHYESDNNTVRNSHPAPGNPNRDNGGGNKDTK